MVAQSDARSQFGGVLMVNVAAKRTLDTTVTPDGKTVLVMDLVESFRRHRGRLTRPQICQEMGWPLTPKSLAFVYKICARWEITTAHFRSAAPVNINANADAIRRERTLEVIAKARLEQIAAAKLEAATAPPYKHGDLSW